LFNRSLVKKTNQGGKLVAFAVLKVLGGVLLLYSFTVQTSIVAIFAAIALGLLGLLLGIVGVKCPICGSKWLWLALRDQGIGQWLAWLMSLNKCPECGHSQE